MMRMKRDAKTVTLYAVLIALAMVFSFLETLIPPVFALPGMRLGITNVVVLTALYLMGWKSAVLINLVRVMLVALLFGNTVSVWFSLAGAVSSGLIMILLKKSGKFGMAAVSVAGAVAHNIGQIAVAAVLLGGRAIFWYLIVLWFTGVISGFLIGLLGNEICRRLQKFGFGGAAL